MPTLASNKKAFHDYSIDDTVEAGLVLAGHEVKSIRGGQVSLNGAYVTVRNGQAYLRNAYVGKLKQAAKLLADYQETQERKLLLHASEILRLTQKLKEKGLSLIPLEIYTKNRLIKLKLGVARGKKQYDKRESIKTKELKRKLDRVVRKRV